MDYNLLIGGSAGQGMDTISVMLEKILKRNGLELFSTKDYMSRVRGGHNFIQIRFGDKDLYSHSDLIDCIIALNEETINNHIEKLKPSGVVLCDESISFEDKRIKQLPLKNEAKNIGNPKVFGSIAIGAVIKIFGMDLTRSDDVINSFFNDKTAEQNISALKKGYDLVNSIFSPLSEKDDEKILINGNNAIALGAIFAGCRFYSAYPMTPSTSIMNYIASNMEDLEIVVEQAEDEIAAINMAIGASYAGVRAMTGTSGGGFSLMVEALGMASMIEVPVVIAEIQRPGPATGLPTRTEQSDLKFIVSASHGEFPRLVIALKNPRDAFYQTIRAFNLADKYRIPVILVGDQYLADYTATIKPFDFSTVENNRYLNNDKHLKGCEYKTYEITDSGISDRIIPGSIPSKTVCVDSDEHDEYGNITESAEMRIKMSDKRLNKSKLLCDELIEPEFIGDDEFDTLLIGWGSTHGPIKEAIDLLNNSKGNKYSGLVFGDIWPLPKKILKEKVQKAKRIINIEQNATSQLASIIRESTGITMSSSILKYDGRPLSSDEIAQKITAL